MNLMGRVALSSLFACALALAGCGGDGQQTPAGGAAKATAGKIIVDGSSTVFRISRAAQIAYKKKKPDVEVLVANHGTGGGFGAYLEGDVDIVDASRTADPAEESKAKEKGLEWTRFTVGYDGITLVKHPTNNFVNSMTVEQLKKLFEPESKVQTWKELDPSWPDRKIVLYTPDTDSGTFEFFTEVIVGKKNAQRKDVQPSPDDNVLVTGVAGDNDGLGYFGYAYYAANKDKLGCVAVQNGPDAKPILPSPETILDQSYKPLSRPLFLFVKNSAMKRPEVADFLKYYIENVNELAKKGGYVPPHEEDQKANLAALPGAAEGEAKK